MTPKEKEEITRAIINVVDQSAAQVKILVPKLNIATKAEKKEIIADILNHYINLDIKIPFREKLEGVAIEKVVGAIMDYIEKKLENRGEDHG